MAAIDAELLAPLRAAPGRSGVLTDFDGTLAQIVDEPHGATALPGAVEVLRTLARTYRRVAIVSGRPVSFLLAQLGLEQPGGWPPEDDDLEGLFVSGLYGLEAAAGGAVTSHPAADAWRDVVEAAAARAEAEAPEGVLVERKGLSVTLHYRVSPEHKWWAGAFAEAVANETGLHVHAARQSAELRPPIGTDKGTVVGDLGRQLDAVCFLGDDVGDLPAFDALDRLALEGAHVVKVVARSSETPRELLARADIAVAGPEGALRLLRALARP